MKQTFAIATILICITVKAQNFSIGPTIGFGHSWISNQVEEDLMFNPSWNAGLSFNYSTKKNFGIGADLKYLTEGNKFSYLGAYIPEAPPSGKTTEWHHFNYLRLPVKFIYFFGQPGKRLRPKIYAGPDFGIGTKLQVVEKNNGDKYKAGVETYYKSFDVGITAAAGLNFRLASSTWLNTDVAYYNGLQNISKTNSNNRNRNIELSIGLLTGLKKKK